ncbi:unnamed protein product, partial [Brenthis ino]
MGSICTEALPLFPLSEGALSSLRTSNVSGCFTAQETVPDEKLTFLYKNRVVTIESQLTHWIYIFCPYVIKQSKDFNTAVKCVPQ